jgi:hypothetical protein
MIVFARPVLTRGAYASSRTSGAGCDGRVGAARRAARARTAKSRGPDAPTLALSLEGNAPQRRRGLSSPAPRGERAIDRKTIARGMPVDPAEPVVTAACVFCCRRAMGEAITRHSPRPLDLGGSWYSKLGQILSRGRGLTSPLSCSAKAGHPVFQRLLDPSTNASGMLDRPIKSGDDSEFAV